MPTRRIGEVPAQRRCWHPDHRPPEMMVFPPGQYEHTCPWCGEKTTFVVPKKEW